MKIAFIGTHGIPARYGGSETYVEETGLRLKDRNHEITVFGCSSKFRIERKEYKGIKILNLPPIPIKSLDYPIRGVISTFIAVLKGYDVYHLTGPDSGFYALLTRTFRRRKNTIATLDGFPEDKESYSKLTKFLLKIVFKLSVSLPNIVIVDSNYIIKQLKTRYEKDFVYVPYGGNVDESKADTTVLKKYNLEDKNYYIFVGRLVKEKGVHILVEGFRKANPNKKLILLGVDQYKGKYEKKLKEQASESTEFLGAVYGKDYEELCKGAYAYITASNLEGSSPALIQAMAYGLPTIVSDIPQNVEVVGEGGLHFKKNDVDDLKDKIRLIDDNPELAEELSRKAKKRVMEIYNWDKIVDTVEELYSNN